MTRSSFVLRFLNRTEIQQLFAKEGEIPMKSVSVTLLCALLAGPLAAQQPAPSTPTSQGETQRTISSRLGLHAFPAKGQNREQQQADELACYNWARQDTGFDPLEALTAAQQAKSTAPTSGTAAPPLPGAGVKGAAGGAGVGAAIGAIGGDPGKGAAIGAASGGIRGRMAQKRAQAEAQQRAQQQAQQQATQQSQAKAKTQAGLEDFKRAYSACMDPKGYSLK